MVGGGVALCRYGSAAVGGRLVFAGRDENRCEPWITDGVTVGLLADIHPGPAESLGFTDPLFQEVGDVVLFSAEHPGHGVETISLSRAMEYSPG